MVGAQRGWIQWLKARSFFIVGQGSIPIRAYLKPWGNLEVVVECVAAPRDIILNGIVNRPHISGSKSIPASFENFKDIA